MLNLLFISNSPKVQTIKAALQPVLKVIIDVVPDFDHGLKDVFEKRPATVCIQDQISGVTGESVARHIQMLLGAGAPRFILMHNANAKIKPIKGLFEHVIDLSQPDSDLESNITDTLKTLMGDHWAKIYVQPSQAVAPVPFFQVENQEIAGDIGRLPGEVLMDLEPTSFSNPEDSQADFLNAPNPFAEIVKPQSSVDEMAEMLLEQAIHANQQSGVDSGLSTIARPVVDASRIEPSETVTATVAGQPEAETEQKPKREEHHCHVIPLKEKPAEEWQQNAVLNAAPTPQKIQSQPVVKKAPVVPKAATPVVQPVKKAVAETTAPVVPPPSEFKINHGAVSQDEPIPEDLLQAFEKNYRSESQHKKRNLSILFAVLIVALGCSAWFFLKQNTDFAFLSSKPAQVPDKSSSATQKQAKPQPNQSAQPVAAKAGGSLPAFIPLEGRDSSYGKKIPWERFVGSTYEVRVFKSGSSIKAIQFVSHKGESFSDTFTKSVLNELVGNSDFKIYTTENRSGVMLLRATASKDSELLLHKKGSSVRAFVISLK